MDNEQLAYVVISVQGLDGDLIACIEGTYRDAADFAYATYPINDAFLIAGIKFNGDIVCHYKGDIVCHYKKMIGIFGTHYIKKLFR